MKKKLTVLILICVLMFSGMSVFAAPKTMADGGIFDPEYYAATYPDVAAAFGTDENLLYQHYLICGKAEGRLPYAPGTTTAAATASTVKTMPDGGLFDPVYYYAANPDVAAVFGNNETLLYQHYLLNGKAEGRLPYAGTAAQAAATKAAATSTTTAAAATTIKAASTIPAGYGPGRVTLQLSASNLSACYRLLRTDGTEEFRVFLSPGQTVSKSFYAGKYKLKVAEGTTWISDSKAFGSSGYYSQTDTYTFEAGGSYSIKSSTTHGDFRNTTASGFLN